MDRGLVGALRAGKPQEKILTPRLIAEIEGRIGKHIEEVVTPHVKYTRRIQACAGVRRPRTALMLARSMAKAHPENKEAPPDVKAL